MQSRKVQAADYHAIPGRAGRIIRIPTRALTASDELFKVINRHAAIKRVLIVGQCTGQALRRRTRLTSRNCVAIRTRRW
jgi:hypothetical protein